MPVEREMLMSTHQTHLHTAVDRDGAAILDTKLGRISTLNVTGAYIWQALDKGETPEAIARALARETGEPLAVIEFDVQLFLESLKQQHLSPC
jgi:hypothetical protein